MLKSIRLVNFQAHLDTLIELDDGITSLTGESHEGKTSINRGLNWAINNEPAGTGFVSYWAKHQNKSGATIIDIPCKVECVKEDGQTLVRERSDKFNGYIINGKKLGRAGVGVPIEVRDWFNMGEVNIQSQHDSLFLLHPGGKGGQEVARFLNSVVKLDEIPRALSAIESKKRAVKKLRDIETTRITEYSDSLEQMKWVATVDPLFERLQKIEKDLSDMQVQADNIIEEIEQYDGLIGVLEIHKWIKEVSPLVERWGNIFGEELGHASLEGALSRSITSFTEYTQYLSDHKWIESALEAVKEVNEIEYEMGMSHLYIQNVEQQVEEFDIATLFVNKNKPWLESIVDNMEKLEGLEHTLSELTDKGTYIFEEIKAFKRNEDILSNRKTTLQKEQKRLPAVCPLCSQPWKGDKHESSR